MTKRLDRNVLVGAYLWNNASVEAHGIKASFFEQSAIVLPAFL